jgi:hypothetical protein
MMNPLDRIKRRQQAAAAAKPPAPAAPIPVRPAAGKLEQYQAAVAAAINAMAPMTNLDERQAYKRKVLPEIMPFVDDYVAKGDRYPNSVAVQAMIWLFDIGDIERALNLALILIEQGHLMPKRFDRDMPTFVCDAVYDWANAQLKADQPAAPYLEHLIGTLEKGRWPLHPAVASKLYAMAAKHAERDGDFAKVVALCEAAQRVNPEGAGVKTLKERAAAKLAATA